MKSALLIGAGGIGNAYAARFFGHVADRARIGAVCDIVPAARNALADRLDLPPERRYADSRTAIADSGADFCLITTQPWYHREPLLQACAAGLPVLMEKPITSELDQLAPMARAVADSGIRCQIVQNYRYTRRMLTFRELLRDGRLGRLQYVQARFADDYRAYGSWGGPNPFRHEMDDPMVLDGSIHHLDMLRHLTGGDPQQVFGAAFNPSWSSFKGHSAGLYVIEFDNDTRAAYEANLQSAGEPNSWYREYYRAECEDGSITSPDGDTVVLTRAGQIEEKIPVGEDPRQGHVRVLEQFLDWIEHDTEPECTFADNLNSVALMFAARATGHRRQAVPVAEFLPGPA